MNILEHFLQSTNALVIRLGARVILEGDQGNGCNIWIGPQVLTKHCVVAVIPSPTFADPIIDHHLTLLDAVVRVSAGEFSFQLLQRNQVVTRRFHPAETAGRPGPCEEIYIYIKGLFLKRQCEQEMGQ